MVNISALADCAEYNGKTPSKLLLPEWKIQKVPKRSETSKSFAGRWRLCTLPAVLLLNSVRQSTMRKLRSYHRAMQTRSHV